MRKNCTIGMLPLLVLLLAPSYVRAHDFDDGTYDFKDGRRGTTDAKVRPGYDNGLYGFYDDTLYYHFYGSENVYVDGLKDPSVTSIVIPSRVVREYNNRTYTVSMIGGGAFNACTNLTSVIIPNSVATIDFDAFEGCSGLTNVTIPDSVTSIKGYAFRNCGRLTSVRIPNRVTSIEGYTFYGCSGLTSVTIPDSVTSIEDFAFSGCSGLTSVRIPDSVTSIGSYAFYGCSGLTGVTIGNSVTSIGRSAFYGCSGLTSVTIPDSVTSIGLEAFCNCSGLKSVTIGNGVTSIESCSFQNCTGLTNVVIGSGVTSIGTRAFKQCIGLTSVSIPDSVEDIGSDAFLDCSGLTNVVIGSGVTFMGGWALYCRELATVCFKGPPPSVGWLSLGTGLKSGAIGTYLPEHKAAWDEVIGSDGKWNGLIMKANKPILSSGGCNVPTGELTIRWDDANAPMPPGMTYEVRRGFSDDYAASEVLTNGYAQLSFVDKDFYATGGVSRIWYWVKPEHPLFEASDPIVTRNRFLLSVGYTGYSRPLFDYASPIPQTFNDAKSLHECCINGNFKICQLKRNIEKDGLNGLRNEMEQFSYITQPGDIFVFYIGTHGSVSADSAHLVMYRKPDYVVKELQEDVRRFNPGVAVVGIIFACHSGAMTGQPVNSGIAEWLTKCGLDQCLGNVAWITSCEAFQYSATPVIEGAFTYFGESLIKDGLMGGYADQRLYGTEYGGGNRDGKITMGELGRYAQVFVRGIRNYPADVQLENEGLLDRIVMSDTVACVPQQAPVPPTDVQVTRGLFERKVRVTWTASSADKYYWVYRYPIESQTQLVWIHQANFGRKAGRGHIDDIPSGWLLSFESLLPFTRYGYRVRAVNPVGISELSEETAYSVGWRGTQAYETFLSMGLFLLSGSSGTAVSGTADEYAMVENMVAPNGFTFGDSYVAGLDPTNETSKFTANVTMSNGIPHVTWSPNLNTNGEVRTYTVWGKTNLTDQAWHTPTNSASRFFKVTVEMP